MHGRTSIPVQRRPATYPQLRRRPRGSPKFPCPSRRGGRRPNPNTEAGIGVRGSLNVPSEPQCRCTNHPPKQHQVQVLRMCRAQCRRRSTRIAGSSLCASVSAPASKFPECIVFFARPAQILGRIRPNTRGRCSSCRLRRTQLGRRTYHWGLPEADGVGAKIAKNCHK